MSRVAIIGVGQSAFVREYPGSVRELAFEGFKDAMRDAKLTAKDIDASVICSAPEYDKQRSPAGVFAEYLGPQLIKAGSVSDLMKQIRRTEVVKAAVEFQGEVRNTGDEVKLRPGGGRKGVGPPPRKVSVQDMIDQIRAKFAISDEEALYIRQVTEEKVADPEIRSTVLAHREDRVYLDGSYRGQVNGEIQFTYNELARYEELADPKYTDMGGIFDIMAVTVIETHLMEAA